MYDLILQTVGIISHQQQVLNLVTSHFHMWSNPYYQNMNLVINFYSFTAYEIIFPQLLFIFQKSTYKFKHIKPKGLYVLLIHK